jgi:hypothetical protein
MHIQEKQIKQVKDFTGIVLKCQGYDWGDQNIGRIWSLEL